MKSTLFTLLIFMVAGWAVAQKKTNIQDLIEQTHSQYATVTDGKNADYIPYLANIDPNLFGIAIVDLKGRTYATGDADYEFGIESISKVMMYCLALQQHPVDSVEKWIGTNATGLPFNSVMAVELNAVHTVNPFVNAGAMATNSLVTGTEGRSKDATIDAYYAQFANRKLPVIQELFESEMATNQHNVAIAVLLQSYGYMYADPVASTTSYTRQCSFGVTAKDLAMMAAVLANNGKHPVTGEQLVAPENVPKVLAVMATAGLYDSSGTWLFHVGLPAKSGVGGGIMAVVPGKYGIAVFAPPLDGFGNSVKAQLAIQEITEKLKLNIFLD